MDRRIKQKFNSHNWLVHQIWNQKIPSILPFIKGNLLDIGCGHKPHLNELGNFVTNYIGLEHPATQSKSQVVDIYGTGTELPFADESFDTVVSFAVLEHVNEPELMLQEANRILKNSGYIIITAPHIWGLHEEPHDYFRYTRYGLEFLLKQAGFTVISISALAGFWVTYCQRFCYYLTSFRHCIPNQFLITLYSLIQKIGEYLDKLHLVESETWAYLAIGQKV